MTTYILRRTIQAIPILIGISIVVFAIVYLVGIPWLRTAVWAVSVVGMAMIAVSPLGSL